ncbi:S24 family peptidase [Hyphomicrobium sp.]|uniref:S24 family peptidase n=1 Tax=Hyphomicrobium sp. TaxID=82 RepID=UPI0025C3F914|nr:S24 family peptidase [Hyphomicrobium sp.]MCC7253840.1 S24 family peptidase [Hyphomicrobium sp.]
MAEIVEFFGESPSGERGDDQAAPQAGGIREVDMRAGLGGGGFESREVVHNGSYSDPLKSETWRFPSSFMREEVRAPESRILIAESHGDSMFPTIASGERLLIDTGHKVPTPDGIYALRDRFGALIIKRLQVARSGEPPRVLIISDNKSHPVEDVGLDEIVIVGRVLFGLKRY